MSDDSIAKFQKYSLVLYKSSPARVLSVGQKIEIELPDHKTIFVRDKDIQLLHIGPIMKFSELDAAGQGELEEACSMLYGESTTLELLAELIYGSFTPASAWEVCKLLQDGLHFTGTLEKIEVRSKEDKEKIIQTRNRKSAEKDAWQAFVDRVRHGKIIDEDRERLLPLQDVAFGKIPTCKILKELSLPETPVQAHSLLLRLGYWDEMVNPYIQRLGFSLDVTYPEFEVMPDDDRIDLTGLPAFAIDDDGNQDPDDAISIDGNKLWVHIADVASVITPDNQLDLHARELATTLYLPEKTVPMLPPRITELFGLGLQEISPALSFGITLNESGAIDKVEIALAKVKVRRMTYNQVQTMLQEAPFRDIFQMTCKYRDFRKSQNAVFLSFPEAKIKVIDGKVNIKYLPDMDSKEMVSECMLMAGEAAARFAIENCIAFPYATQQPPDTIENPHDYAGMFSYRRKLKPGEVKLNPDQHAALGLKAYSRVTSPLRRYLDLVTHQQIRSFLKGQTMLDEQAILNRIGASAALVGSAANLERLSNLHWTLVYLMQNPGWKGKGVVVDKKDSYSLLLIPEIALETRISPDRDLSLNQEIEVSVSSINLPELTARFVII